MATLGWLFHPERDGCCCSSCFSSSCPPTPSQYPSHFVLALCFPRTRKMAIILYANLVAALTNLRPRLQGNRTGTGREQGRADERGADGGLLVGWWVGWAGARLAGWLPKSRSDSGRGRGSNNNSAPRILI